MSRAEMKTDAEEATCAEASAGESQTLLWFSSLGGGSLVRPDFRLRGSQKRACLFKRVRNARVCFKGSETRVFV